MSAQASLAGLYPPEGDQIWNENILWQPIPVHTLPKNADQMLIGTQPCPKFMLLLAKQLEESPEIRALYGKYGKRFPYWTQQSGMNIATPIDVFLIFNVLLSEREHNKT